MKTCHYQRGVINPKSTVLKDYLQWVGTILIYASVLYVLVEFKVFYWL